VTEEINNNSFNSKSKEVFLEGEGSLISGVLNLFNTVKKN
jgi:hypothetical protein